MESEMNEMPDGDAPAEISRLEEKIEVWRQRISLFLGPLLALVLWLIPMPGLSSQAHTLAAIISWVVVWWIGEPVPIPVSAILGAVLCVLTGVGDAKTVLAPFAEPTIFLFLGSFVLARAMSVHALDRRFAYGILSLDGLPTEAGAFFLPTEPSPPSFPCGSATPPPRP